MNNFLAIYLFNASLMKRIKELEDENRRLKKVYAEEKLKTEIIKEALEKKVVAPTINLVPQYVSVAMLLVSVKLVIVIKPISQWRIKK